MALLSDIKVALRIKSTAFDTAEVTPIIEACFLDLRIAGVNVIEETDPLIQRAVILYAKANFGFDGESERYQKAYEALKNSLALSGDYGAYAVTFAVEHEGAAVKNAKIAFGGKALETNSLGVAVFYTRADKIDVDYTVSHDDYDSVEAYVYVAGSTEVSVEL